VNIIDEKFKTCKSAGRAAFVAYITAGDPDFNTSLKVIDTLYKAGVDIIELGVPFSDPLADGTANQLAAERALNSGMTPLKVLELAETAKKKYPELPFVLFTYMNPIAYSSKITFTEFCKKAVESGIDAVLPLDLPPEELDSEVEKKVSYRNAMANAELSNVVLIAPTTPEKRFAYLAGTASSFIYYVSREGVTGEGSSFGNQFSERITLLRKYTDKPIVVGFGISTPDHVKTAAESGVDGVVVGSAIVRKIEQINREEASFEELYNFVSSMTLALKNN
jgi:tryptophan synthase alpha chain